MECIVRPTYLSALPSDYRLGQQTRAHNVTDTIFKSHVWLHPAGETAANPSSITGLHVNACGRWRGRGSRNLAIEAVTSYQRQQLSAVTSAFLNGEECHSLVCRALQRTGCQQRKACFCGVLGSRLDTLKLSYGSRVPIGETRIETTSSSSRSSNRDMRFPGTVQEMSGAGRAQARGNGLPKAMSGDDDMELEPDDDDMELEPTEKPQFVPPTGGVYGRESVEKLFSLKVERPSKERLEELCVSKWSRWESGRSFWAWEWKVDELCFIEKGELEITPRDSTRSAVFKAGDLVTFPKWLRARCQVLEPLEMRYRFRAIGDAVGVES